MQDPKNRHLGTIAQLCRAMSSQLRHVSTKLEKKLVKQQYLLHMCSQYGELRPNSSWDRYGSLGHPSEFQRVSRLGSVTARHSSTGRQPNFAALNRESHLCSAGRPSRWALAHILVGNKIYIHWITEKTNLLQMQLKPADTIAHSSFRCYAIPVVQLPWSK